MTLLFYYGTGDWVNRVRLGSGFSFTEAASSGILAMSRIQVDDPAADLTIVGHHDFRALETACSWPTLFKGYFADRDSSRAASMRLGAARRWDGTVYDLNAALQFEIIRGSDAKRDAETDTQRLAWFLGSGFTGPISTDGSAVFGAGVNLDAQDYRGMTAADLLSDCAQVSGNDYWVAWDEAISAPRLHYYLPSRAYNDCTLKISNVAADLVTGSVLPPSEDTKLSQDPSRVYSGVYYRYGDGTAAVYRHDDAIKAAIGHKRETSYTDITVKSKAKAEAKADKWLAEAATELDVITTTLYKVRPQDVNLIRAGQRIQVKFTHLTGYSSYTWVRITRRTVAQDGDTQQFYRLDLELTRDDKQGGTHVRHPSPNGNQPNVPSAPDLNAPACTTQASTDTANWVEYHPSGASLVFGNGAGWGAENLAWPLTPCGVGAGAWWHPFWAGGRYELTAPVAGDHVFVKISGLGPSASHGNAISYAIGIIDGSSPTWPDVPPNIVATGGAAGDDIIIPAGCIPWGGPFNIVVFPTWKVDAGGYVCAIAGGQRPEQTGQLGCGEFSGFPSTITVQYHDICDGAYGWIDGAAREQGDGSTTTFTLVGWDGTDLPVVFRNGVRVPLASTDPSAGTVTLSEVPQSGDVITARYHVGDTPA